MRLRLPDVLDICFIALVASTVGVSFYEAWNDHAIRAHVDLVVAPFGAPLTHATPHAVQLRGKVRRDGASLADALVCGFDPLGERPRCVRTNSAGEYELEVTVGSIAVVVSAPNSAPIRGEVRSQDPLDFNLLPGGARTHGIVRNLAGDGIAGAVVIASETSREAIGALAITDSRGYFELWASPHALELTVHAEGHAVGEMRPAEGPLDIYLAPESIVHGRVVRAATGTPVEGVIVSAHDRVGRSDASGYFRIDGLSPGSYPIIARASEFFGEHDRLVLGLGEMSPEIVIEVEPAVDLRGEVDSHELGKPCDGRISLYGGASTAYGKIVAGRVALDGVPRDVYSVSISCNGQDSRIEYPKLLVASSRGGLSWDFLGGTALRGRVVDASGQPIPFAGVHATPLPLSDRRKHGDADTDRSGSFSFEDLDVGQYAVSLGLGDVPRQEVFADGIQELELVVHRTPLGESISQGPSEVSGVVFDEMGDPVSDALVLVSPPWMTFDTEWAFHDDAWDWSWAHPPVLTDAEGRFSVDVSGPAHRVIRVFRQGGGKAHALDVRGGDRIELFLSPPGVLEGVIREPRGTVPDAFFVEFDDPSTGVRVEKIFKGTAGRWRIENVSAGTIHIFVSAESGTIQAEVELAEGEHRNDLLHVLVTRRPIHGRVIDLESGQPIEGIAVRMSDRRDYGFGDADEHITDAGGWFELPQMGIGPSWLVISSPLGGEGDYDAQEHFITVDATDRTEVGDLGVVASRVTTRTAAGSIGFSVTRSSRSAPEKFEAVVDFIDPGGPAEASGLELGDVIERVDGHPVTGHPGRFEALTMVPPGTSLVLTLRDGTQVVVVAGLANPTRG